MKRILVFPQWRDNPYLNMLYLGVRAEGWQVAGEVQVPALLRQLEELGQEDVFHLHWTAPICQSEEDPQAARAALTRFRSHVDQALQRGTRLVWTIHNEVPHDCRHLDLEVELARYLAASAWRIIQLNPATRAVVAGLYSLPPEKLVTLPHASYQGIYAQAPADARQRLGVPALAPVVGFVGQLRPYKGIGTLTRAVTRLADSVPGLTLLLAGRASPPDVLHLKELLPPVTTITHFGFVPDDQLGLWFGSADVMVFPYEKILNSGSVMLSATFARPCVLPNDPHLLELYGDQPWVRFFDRSAPEESLVRILRGLLAEAAPLQESAAAYASSYTMFDMAWDYRRIINGTTATDEGHPS